MAPFRKECQHFVSAERQTVKQDAMKSLCKMRSDRHMGWIIIINMNFKIVGEFPECHSVGCSPTLPSSGAERARGSWQPRQKGDDLVFFRTGKGWDHLKAGHIGR